MAPLELPVRVGVRYRMSVTVGVDGVFGGDDEDYILLRLCQTETLEYLGSDSLTCQ